MRALLFTFTAALLSAAPVIAVAREAPGRSLYQRECAACHGPSGEGFGGAGPKLAGRVNSIAADPRGRKYLANLLTYGLAGDIEVENKIWSGYMPGVDYLSHEERAQILNFLLASGSRPFTSGEVKTATSQPRTPEEVHELRPKKKL